MEKGVLGAIEAQQRWRKGLSARAGGSTRMVAAQGVCCEFWSWVGGFDGGFYGFWFWVFRWVLMWVVRGFGSELGGF